jgi:hypothetical protein
MELMEILYLVAFIVISTVAIKTYSTVELNKQDRISEERERKAQIYANRDMGIANTEAAIYNGSGFQEQPQDGGIGDIMSILSNPDMMKMAGEFFKQKEGAK